MRFRADSGGKANHACVHSGKAIANDANGRQALNEHSQNGEDESRGAANWLSDLVRVYGGWHLAATILQGIVWAGFVSWNEIGDHPNWRDTLQAVAGETWMALPAFSITSIAILAAAQKGGRIVLTFIDERRQRIRKAQAEARAEGRDEARSEMAQALRRNPRIDDALRDYPEIRETLKDLGVDLRDDEKNGGE